MSIVLKFRRDSTDLSLMGGATGLQLVDSGWIPAVATPVEGNLPSPVIETMELEGGAANQDALAIILQSLHLMQAGAERYIKDRAEEHPVWLHVKLDNETGERRALVHRIDVSFGASWFGAMAADNKMAVSLGIMRGPWWERTVEENEMSAVDLSTLGGAMAITTVAGDAPCRLYQLKAGTSLAGRTMDELWLGFRSSAKHGVVTNFVPLWEAEDATAGTDTALAADSTASPGGAGNTKMVCTFATVTDWDARVTFYLTDMTSNFEEQFGRFVVLMRAKATDGSTKANVRIRQRPRLDPDSIIEGRVVEVSGTDWKIYEMGPATIPLRDLHAFPQISAAYETYFTLQAFSRRTAGSSNLEIDCLLLIPADEYFIHVANAGIDNNEDLYVGMSPEGTHSGVTLEIVSSEIADLPAVSAEGFGVPISAGRVFGVVARASRIHNITDDWDLGIKVIPRWSSLRGGE